MQIISPSKITMSSPRNAKSPKAKLNRVISAQLRSIQKSQCQSQLILIDKNTNKQRKQQNSLRNQSSFKSKQMEYVQLIRQLNQENKKLKQKFTLQGLINVQVNQKYQNNSVQPSKSPNLTMGISPVKYFNNECVHTLYHPTHKRGYTVVNAASIPFCSPIRVHRQKQNLTGQQRRGQSPIRFLSPFNNKIVHQSMNCSPKKSFQSISALNSQIFNGTKKNILQNSTGAIENNSILIEDQGQNIKYKKNIQKNQNLSLTANHRIFQKNSANLNANLVKPSALQKNQSFINKLYFTYTKKEQPNISTKSNIAPLLNDSSNTNANQPVINPLKLLQGQFNQIAQMNRKKIQTKQYQKKKGFQQTNNQVQDQKENLAQKKRSLHTFSDQSPIQLHQFDINKNIQLNPILHSLKKRISKEFYYEDYQQEDKQCRTQQNKQNCQKAKTIIQRQVQNDQELMIQQNRQKSNNSLCQVPSSYNENIRFQKNGSQNLKNRSDLDDKSVNIVSLPAKQSSYNNIQGKKSMKSLIQLVRMEQSQNQHQNLYQQPVQSIKNFLDQSQKKIEAVPIAQKQLELTQWREEKQDSQDNLQIFTEIHNSLQERQKLSDCYQYKLFYGSPSLSSVCKENQTIGGSIKSSKKGRQQTNLYKTENMSTFYKAQGTMNKTTTQYRAIKCNRYGDCNVSKSSLRSSKFSQISNKAYL